MALSRNFNFLEPLFIRRERPQTTAAIAKPGTVGGFGVTREIARGLGEAEVPFLPETSPFRYLPGKLAEETTRFIAPQTALEAPLYALPIGKLAKPLAKTPVGKLATKEVGRLFKGGIKETAEQVNKKLAELVVRLSDLRNSARYADMSGRLAQKKIPIVLNEIAQEEAKKYGAKYKTIPITEIRASFKANRELDISKIEQISSDIKKTGEVKPLFADKYGIIDGHNRLIALQRLGVKEIPVFQIQKHAGKLSSEELKRIGQEYLKSNIKVKIK